MFNFLKKHLAFIAAGAALCVLLGLSHALDRAQTSTADVQPTGGLALTQVDVLLPQPHVLSYVWSVQSIAAANPGMTIQSLPAGASMAVAVSGNLSAPLQISWRVPGTEYHGEFFADVKPGGWQNVRLPSFPGEAIVEIHGEIRADTESLAISQVFFLDPLHGQTARAIGRLATALLCLVWIALLATFAASAVRRGWPTAQGTSLVLLSFFGVALAGYLTFFAYFAHPRLGDGVVVAIGCAVAIKLWRNDSAVLAPWKDAAWSRPWLAMLAIGLVYLGWVHAWQIDAPYSWLAIHRYNLNLPGDNWIPQVVADRVLHGLDSRKLDTDWLTSDRPPLQSGWTLLLGPVLRTNRYLFDSLCQMMGFWLQLAWVPALAACFQLFGVSSRRSLTLVFIVSLTGFALVQSMYVWPKMAAAAFLLGSWVWLFTRPANRITSRDWVVAGIGFGLGFLSHGGAAFALIGAAPLLPVLTRTARHKALLSVLTAVILCLPWFAYQKFYQPPGNRLLKWHLAGVTAVDGRGSWETLRAAYAAKSTTELWTARRVNFDLAFRETHWRELVDFSQGNFVDRRNGDFFRLVRSVGWWNLGLLLLPFAWWSAVRRARQGRARFNSFALVRTLAWIALTLGVWLLLMFEPFSTYIHQGSYVPPLLLIGLGVWSLAQLHVVLLGAVTAAATVYFAAVYGFSAPVTFRTDFAWSSLLFTVAGIIAWYATIFRAASPAAAPKASGELNPSP